MSECFHGLDAGLCDICTPRQAPVTTRVRSASSRSTGPARGGSAAPVKRSSTAPIDPRVYLVVGIGELAGTLRQDLADADGWRGDVGGSRSREDAILVAPLRSPNELQLVAAANEPARRRIAEAVAEGGRRVRVVVNPAWFA